MGYTFVVIVCVFVCYMIILLNAKVLSDLCVFVFLFFFGKNKTRLLFCL